MEGESLLLWHWEKTARRAIEMVTQKGSALRRKHSSYLMTPSLIKRNFEKGERGRS
jgi:hypothetical protein